MLWYICTIAPSMYNCTYTDYCYPFFLGVENYIASMK